MLALLVRVPGCVVWKVTLRAALPVLVRLPSEQTTAPPRTLQLPWEEDAETNMALGGIGLVTLTPVAMAGPWLVATIVKVTLLPTITGLGAAEMPAKVTSIEFRSMQQVGSIVVRFKVQPLVILPEKPDVSSKT